MSTFLVSLGVVAATIAAVVYVALTGPDQPPTIRRQPSRGKERRERRAEARAGRPETEGAGAPPTALGLSTDPALALPDSDMMRLPVLPARGTSVGSRIRSSVVLVVLVAVLGALLALAIGGLALGLALLVRSATA